MTRNRYLNEVIRLYLDAPRAPAKPTPRDWAIALDLYRLGVRLCHFEHAIRLATLRRLSNADPPSPIRSLAYYRTVLQGLTPDELHPDYILYVRRRHRQLPDTRRQKSAAKPPDSRVF